jgi:hypothetical protein
MPWSRSFLYWVQNTAEVRISVCIRVSGITVLRFIRLFVYSSVFLCDLSI